MSDVVCTRNKLLQVGDNKLVTTCYEQLVLVLLEQLVASLLPSSTLQGCIFFYNSPPPPGVGEKNQRVLGLGKKIKEE
jgi:hypothetical protein